MKPIIGYENIYFITGDGEVISYARGFQKILKFDVDKQGYYYVLLYKNGNRKHRPIHQLVLEAFCVEKPVGSVVNHKDGNRSNNKLSNLEYITPSENMKHSYKYLGRKSTLKMKGKTGNLHHLSKSFYVKDLKQNIIKYESGFEFERLTGLKRPHLSEFKKSPYIAQRGKKKGYTFYFE